MEKKKIKQDIRGINIIRTVSDQNCPKCNFPEVCVIRCEKTMNGLTFTEIANNVTFLYLLVLIVVFLAFIAYKVSSSKKRHN